MAESGLDKAETRASLVSFNWNLAYRMMFESICGSGTFIFVAFALALGLRKENMGLMAAVASWATFVQMFGLPLVTRVKNRRALVLSLGFIEPVVLIAAVAAVPFAPPALRMTGLVLAVLAGAACVNLTRPILDDWIASVVPADLRGRYWGRRLQLAAAVSLVVVPVVGFVANGLDAGNPRGLALLLAAGGGLGILAAVALRGAVIPPLMSIRPVQLVDIPATLRVPLFRRFLLAVTVTSGPFFFVCAYYQVFHLSILHMSLWAASCTTLAYGVTKTVAAPLWGRLVNRLGARGIMLAVLPLYVVFFAAYAICTPERLWILYAAWALAGVADPAFGVAVQVTLYRSVPPDGVRPAFFAVYNLVALGLYGIGSLVSVAVLRWIEPCRLTVGPFVLDQFRLFFAGAAVLAALCVLGAFLLPGRSQEG